MTKDNEPFLNDARKISETALGHFRASYETISESSNKTLDAFQAALSPDAQEFNKKVFSYAQNNIKEMFDLAQKLLEVSSPEEVMKLQTRYLVDQAQVIQKQATDLTNTIQKTISKSVVGGSGPRT